jgi:hypothetical protein
MQLSVGFYRCTDNVAALCARAADGPVVLLGSMYSTGVTTGTPELFLYDQFNAAALRGTGLAPLVVAKVDTERVEKEMLRALQPWCPPVLLHLPRRPMGMIAAIKAEYALRRAGDRDRRLAPGSLDDGAPPPHGVRHGGRAVRRHARIYCFFAPVSCALTVVARSLQTAPHRSPPPCSRASHTREH